MTLRKLFAEQRQHCRIGKMKQGDGGGEEQQRTAFEQRPEPLRLVAGVSIVGAARELMIN